MAVKHLEIERKYDAAADFGLPDLSGLPGVASIAGPRTHGLHATYFDTADLRLAAHGITLRRRRGGDDAGWHLKIPAGPDSKQELRAPLGRARIVPARLASLVAAYTRGEPLLPVATLETERTVVRLLDASGETLAEVADDAVSGRDLRGAARVTAPPEVTGQAMPFSSRSAASGATANDADADADGLVSRAPGEPGSVANTGNANGVVTVIDAEGTGVVPAGVPVGEALAPAAAWREIEVELVAGTQELLKAAGKRLRKAGASRAGSSSKLGRLLNDAIEPPPATAARADAEERIGAANGSGPSGKSRSTSAPTTGDAVVAYLAAQVEAILRYDPKARLAEHDAVHRMRVAVRRTRSALQSYRPVLDRDRTDPLGPELKWLAAELGAVRDLEVLRMRFAGRWLALAPAEAGAEPAWLAEIAERERSAYRGLNAALKEPRYFALLDALDRLVADPPLAGRASGRKARKELPRLVERAWRRLERTYATIGEASDAGVAGLAGASLAGGADGAGAAGGAHDPDTARHDTRKAAKRARYAAELAVPVLGAPASAVARNARRLQETLGGYQDGVIAMEHLRAASARTRDAAGSFALGVLYGVEHCEAERARDALPGVWESLDRPAF
ncbi:MULTISPECIES: CYTH and CHAD domain-containing protein [Actinomadura]|uniref:CHAD domain-containing protein n=1 Tax=Actinomadura yumaensis TaxID=111807 RepID=A0ABW2CG01_9ACTN|nr:CYTH and CHAD domain-containing protein [Actinomadura sp. J1-007]